MKRRDLLIWGGTGQARVLADFIGQRYRIVAVVDRMLDHSPFADAILLRDESDVDGWLTDRTQKRPLSAAVAIGGRHGAERRRLAMFLSARQIDLPVLVHPSAQIGGACTIGAGTQILIGAIIATGTRVGASVIINSGAQVDHDSYLGDGAHIGPGAVTAGEVSIGEDAFVATGAVILPGISIGARATVGAGAVVIEDVAPGITVAGCPARPITNH